MLLYADACQRAAQERARLDQLRLRLNICTCSTQLRAPFKGHQMSMMCATVLGTGSHLKLRTHPGHEQRRVTGSIDPDQDL